MAKHPVSPLQIEFLCTEDGLQGPAAALCDVLRMVTMLGEMRRRQPPVLGWQWTRPDGQPWRAGQGQGRRVALPQVQVLPGYAARNGPHLNRLVARDRAACARLQAVHAAGGHVLALYTGVALAGEARLLDGRRAAVPWPFAQSVQRHAPHLVPAGEAGWAEDTRVWSADSPVLATELMLRVLEACAQSQAQARGRSQSALADLVSSARTVLLHSAERQQLAHAVASDHPTRVGPGMLERARRHLEDHLHEPYSLAATAQAAATSQRSLLRHFQATHGQTPLQMLHALRITRARMLLEATYLPVDVVAERCGWRDTAMLRRVFERSTGLTPAAYRERFRLRTERRRWGQDLAR